MIRRLFTVASALSLLLCVATRVLWARGVGRAEGWYLRPSRSFDLIPPDPSQPSKWCAQWQINWGNDGELSIDRQVKPVNGRPPRLVFFSAEILPARWSPLPESLPPDKPNVVAIVSFQGKVTEEVQRAKPATSLRLLGIQYIAHEQEFGRFHSTGGTSFYFSGYGKHLRKVPMPTGGAYFSSYGEHLLRIPLIYLFILFAIPPIAWLRVYRGWRISRYKKQGRCAACGYDLRANRDRCPECGMPIPAKAEAITA